MPPGQKSHAVLWFAGACIACLLGLFFFGGTSARLPIRVTPYALSVAMIFIVRGTGRPHPVATLLPAIAFVFVVGLLHPDNNGLLATIGTMTLYASVLTPLVWVGKTGINKAGFRRLVLMMWAFYAASAAVGALQVRYPGQFVGAVSSAGGLENEARLSISLADGTTMVRPKGLTDVPGGASVGGIYAIILGFGIFLNERSLLLRAAAVIGMAVGLFGIYLGQGRTNLVIVAVAALVMLAVLYKRRNYRLARTLTVWLLIVVFCATAVAFAVGGESTSARYATLLADSPGKVFYSNRGFFLENMLRYDIYDYPFGAGLGRWGMMTQYFPGPMQALWAEMFWQAALYDGGIPLILLYIAVLSGVCVVGWRRAIDVPDDASGCWGGVVIGFTVAGIAASFVFPIFALMPGMEMMLLNAAFVASVGRPEGTKHRRSRPYASASPALRRRRASHASGRGIASRTSGPSDRTP